MLSWPLLLFFFVFNFFFNFIRLLFDLSLISRKDHCNSQLSLENCQHVAVLVWVFLDAEAGMRTWSCFQETKVMEEVWRMSRGGVGSGWEETSGGSLLSWTETATVD